MIDTRYSEEDVKDWEQLPLVSSVLTSSQFGAWLYYRDKRRDKRVNSELLDKVLEKIKDCSYDIYSDISPYPETVVDMEDIDSIIKELKADVEK